MCQGKEGKDDRKHNVHHQARINIEWIIGRRSARLCCLGAFSPNNRTFVNVQKYADDEEEEFTNSANIRLQKPTGSCVTVPCTLHCGQITPNRREQNNRGKDTVWMRLKIKINKVTPGRTSTKPAKTGLGPEQYH